MVSKFNCLQVNCWGIQQFVSHKETSFKAVLRIGKEATSSFIALRYVPLTSSLKK